jgi:signal transduction histidine kinase
MNTSGRTRLHYVAAVFWILLTVSLASWWMVFGLEEARQLNALNAPEALRLAHVQRMLVWEGATFIGLLLVGGLALLVSIRREQARQRAVSAFFMAFTHDLKTALASLQIQAESLQEDWPDAANNPNLARLLGDTVRLGVQLENSLYFAQPDGGLLLEPIPLARLIERTALDWPHLKVRVDGAATRPDGRINVTARDDGRGAPAEVLRLLGQPFVGRGPASSTGVGLFVSRQLALRMSGDLRFERPTPGSGFTAVLELPSAGQ